MYSSNFTIFIAVVATNLLNFIDRGIIPGASVEFNLFIQEHVETTTPDVYLGFLVTNDKELCFIKYFIALL